MAAPYIIPTSMACDRRVASAPRPSYRRFELFAPSPYEVLIEAGVLQLFECQAETPRFLQAGGLATTIMGVVTVTDLGIAKAIIAARNQLTVGINEAPKLDPESVKIQFKFGVTNSVGPKAKIKFLVLSPDAGQTWSKATTNDITLTFAYGDCWRPHYRPDFLLEPKRRGNGLRQPERSYPGLYNLSAGAGPLRASHRLLNDPRGPDDQAAEAHSGAGQWVAYLDRLKISCGWLRKTLSRHLNARVVRQATNEGDLFGVLCLDNSLVDIHALCESITRTETCDK
jgi:hypothetical protein